MKTKPVTKIVGFQSGHDVSYCILENGIPTLCEELERISRKKMELGDGLKFFFSRYKNTNDIKYFTFGNFRGRSGRYQKTCKDARSNQKMNEIISKNKGAFFEFGHHLSHAANAFYTSSFTRSLIVTVDGGGWENDDVRTGFTVSEGVGNKIKQIKIFPISEVNLGGIWHDLTHYVFGLSVGYPKGDQAGTVMAMATLGKPKYVNLIPEYRANLKKLIKIANTSEQEKFNVAASLQKYTEAIFKKILSKYVKGHTNLCLSGGVSLNCVMLGKIRKWFPEIKNIFCDPVPYDAGLAFGSARYLWHQVLGKPRIKNEIKNISPYLGKTYTKLDVKRACDTFRSKINTENTTDIKVLDKIYNQKIVATYGGRSETGRRALGNRSILADPRNVSMKNQINEKVKHRHWFRPSAPSILEEKVDEWFKKPLLSPYMSFALKYKGDKQKEVPAVTHFDGTGRLQTVNKLLCPWYHSFISKWELLSGVPILLNTSFNDSEPIVETPEDALKCFLSTDIDYLYFFDYGILVEKI
jgi:carbamoyltransferase